MTVRWARFMAICAYVHIALSSSIPSDHGLIVTDVEDPIFTQEMDHSNVANAVEFKEDFYPSYTHTHKIKKSDWIDGRGQGYVAATNLTVNEEIVGIPIAKIMSYQSAKLGRIGAFLESNPLLPEPIVLALHLLEEKLLGDGSRWYDLIQGISQKLNSTLFLSPVDMQIIEGSHLSRLTLQRKIQVSHFHEVLIPHLTNSDNLIFNPQDFTLDNFQWAMAAVWAHSILVINDNEPSEMVPVIAPILSTVGFCLNCTSSLILNLEYGKLSMYATQSYKAGDMIELDFGLESGTLYMVNYGIYPLFGSLDNKIPMTIVVDPEDTYLSNKNEMLGQLNRTMNDSYVIYEFQTFLTPQVLQTMRVKVMTSVEINRFQQVEDNEPVSLRNEYALCRSLLQSIEAMIEQYPTTLEEDIKQLADMTITLLHRYLMETIKDEKSILLNAKNEVLRYWQSLLAVSF